MTDKAERPRDAALGGGLAPAPAPGSGTAELDGNGRQRPLASAAVAAPVRAAVIQLASSIACGKPVSESLRTIRPPTVGNCRDLLPG